MTASLDYTPGLYLPVIDGLMEKLERSTKTVCDQGRQLANDSLGIAGLAMYFSTLGLLGYALQAQQKYKEWKGYRLDPSTQRLVPPG